MEKLLQSDWLRASLKIPKSAITNQNSLISYNCTGCEQTKWRNCNSIFSTVVKLNTFNIAAAVRQALYCVPINEHALRYLLSHKLDFYLQL